MRISKKWVPLFLLLTVTACNQTTNTSDPRCIRPDSPHYVIKDHNQVIGFFKDYQSTETESSILLSLENVVITQKEIVEPWALAGKMRELSLGFEKKDLLKDLYLYDVNEYGTISPEELWVDAQVLDGEAMTDLESCVLFEKVDLEIKETRPHKKPFYPDIQIVL